MVNVIQTVIISQICMFHKSSVKYISNIRIFQDFEFLQGISRKSRF